MPDTPIYKVVIIFEDGTMTDCVGGTELGVILKEKATAATAETIASERKRREQTLSDAVEHVIEGDLLREIAKSWPDEATMKALLGPVQTIHGLVPQTRAGLDARPSRNSLRIFVG